MKIIHILGMLLMALAVKAVSPIEGLLERIDKGASRKFVIEQVKSPADFFELDQKGDKVVIRGNNYVRPPQPWASPSQRRTGAAHRQPQWQRRWGRGSRRCLRQYCR